MTERVISERLYERVLDLCANDGQMFANLPGWIKDRYIDLAVGELAFEDATEAGSIHGPAPYIDDYGCRLTGHAATTTYYRERR